MIPQMSNSFDKDIRRYNILQFNNIPKCIKGHGCTDTVNVIRILKTIMYIDVKVDLRKGIKYTSNAACVTLKNETKISVCIRQHIH